MTCWERQEDLYAWSCLVAVLFLAVKHGIFVLCITGDKLNSVLLTCRSCGIILTRVRKYVACLRLESF